MTKKITINPLTRISGFLEIEVLVEKNRIIDAKSSGLLYRGFEQMLKNRPPLDAVYFSERICGICSTAHSMGSTFALEDALQIKTTLNDKMVRDFIHGCEFLQNHLRQFYQYTLPDFVKGPDISPLYEISHNDYRLPKKINDKLAEHYLKSIKYSRMAHEMLAVLGGKAPHNHGIFVGGVTVNMDVSKWNKVRSLLASIQHFVEKVTLEDVYTLAEFYPEYFHNGEGYSNLMSYGVYDGYEKKQLTYVKPKVYINGNLYDFNESKITENIYFAWYKADKVESEPCELEPDPDITKEKAYSWIKAPRYDGYPMEVGPLARMWLSGIYRRGISTMDRMIARILEMKKICGILQGLLNQIKLIPARKKRYEIPDEAKGRGLIDTTRGALGHWISIKEQTIAYYDIITPTAWNLSPTDSRGVKGVIEKALIGTHIENIRNPVEIGRIVRSFDPCVSCATHVIGSSFKPFKMRLV